MMLSCQPGTRRKSPNRGGRWLAVGSLCVALTVTPLVGLADNVMVGTERQHKSIFSLYEANRREGIPNYVTIDLPLAAYSLIRQNSIRHLEAKTVMPALAQFLTELNQALSGQNAFWNSDAQSDLARQAHARNGQFVGLLLELLSNDDITSPSAHLQREYERILAADSMEESEFWGRTIDYTQFKPRGRYTDSAESERFFRTVRYAGSQFFAVLPSAATGIDEQESALQIEQSLQLVNLIANNEQLLALRQTLEQALSWAFGATDDLTDDDMRAAVVDQVTGESTGDTRRRVLQYAIDRQRQPEIADAIVDLSKLESSHSIKDVLTGWRLLPSRYSVQSAAQQALLVGPTGTGDYQGTDTQLPFGYGVVGGRAVKGFPVALEWLALLGSDAARQQLDADQETAFDGYKAAFENNATLLENLSGSELLHAQIIRAGMHDAAQSTGKELSSFLAFQTWQQYLNVLYTKQSYTPGAKGLRLTDNTRTSADVEIATELYLMLGYAARKQLAQGGVAQWQEFSIIMDALAELSMKAENAIAFDEADARYLNSLDKTLLKLTGGPDLPIVVDVHTEPNSATVVQYATGYPRTVDHAAHGVGMRGARFSFEQFKQPMNNRLTVDEWQSRLAERGKKQ